MGSHGSHAGIDLKKDGYEYVKSNITLWPVGDKADPSNPIIFRMWKCHGAEALLHTKFHDYIPCDGTPVNYKLSPDGKMGDLQVILVLKPLNIDRRQSFDWTLTLRIQAGGLVQIHDIYPYKAPSTGYRTDVSLGEHVDDKQFIGQKGCSYYFKYKNLYGRIEVLCYAFFQPPPTPLQIEVFLNSSGSDILEHDPYKTKDFRVIW